MTSEVTEPRVNEVVIKVATQNGSGSQSANNILMRSIFSMGIPVSAKNLFPSNIQGLPTWFTIRASGAGWTAQRVETDLLICMNPATIADDLFELQSGKVVILPDNQKHFCTRPDLTYHIVPFNALVKEVCEDTRLRKMVINIMYVGVAARLLGIDMEQVEEAILSQFGGKATAIAFNTSAARVGYRWAEEHITVPCPFRLESTDKTNGQIVIEGNEATALGLLYGGASVVAWYPITPSSSVCENLEEFLYKYRRDPETGESEYAVIQAEDEIAAIAMTIGAGWAGARACTATAGPGMSLMTEIAGLAYFAEIPAVIVDVQRMGPSTGLPTRTAQCDVAKAYALSHGDCKHILLIPGNVEECFTFGIEALNLADEFQTLVFLMTDLDLGMNKWVSTPFSYPETPIDRGKVLDAEALDMVGDFARYRDVDGDGIPYRTLPGTKHDGAAFFTRGTGHNEKAGYSEKPEDWVNNMERLARKFDTARNRLPKPLVDMVDNATVGIIAYGSSDPAVQEARAMLQEATGETPSYLRLRALPVNGDVRRFIEGHAVIQVVEQNRDAQVTGILRAEYPELAARLLPVLHYDGYPLDAVTLANQLTATLATVERK